MYLQRGVLRCSDRRVERDLFISVMYELLSLRMEVKISIVRFLGMMRCSRRFGVFPGVKGSGVLLGEADR